MKKKFITALISVLILTGCGQKVPETPPAVEIDAGGITVPNTSNTSYWDNTVYLLNGTASDWIDEYGKPMFFPIGTIFCVTIPPKSVAPDSVTVTDTLIQEDGTPKYDKKAAIIEVVPQIEENVITFSLENHWASGLSSNSEDYKEGTAWHCFEITCNWGENVCVYTFCVRTNPMMIMDNLQ